MPPANSPSDTPLPPSSQLQLQELETPVPDLAATLSSTFASTGTSTNTNTPDLPRTGTGSTRSSVESERWLIDRLFARAQAAGTQVGERGVMSERRRTPPPPLPVQRLAQGRPTGGMPTTALGDPDLRYSDRVPQRQSLYDWAPGTGPGSGSGPGRRPDPQDIHIAAHSDLRSQAIAQAIRRDTARNNDGVGRSNESTTARISQPWASTGPHPTRTQQQQDIRDTLRSIRQYQRDAREQTSNIRALEADESSGRQRVLQEYARHGGKCSESAGLESVVYYMHCLRDSASRADSLAMAGECGLVKASGGAKSPQKSRFQERDPDPDNNMFLELGSVPGPAPSSWLAPGSVFAGSQRAAATAPPVSRMVDLSQRIARRYAGESEHDAPRDDIRRGEDHWPVRVTIHSVDYDNMRLTGEMEAFNVPSGRKSSTVGPGGDLPGGNSITTHLEGELIDLSIHTLRTENYPTSASIDAAYWQKLEPFLDCRTDSNLGECLLARDWLERKFCSDYVLMRWKETRFLHPSDQRLGLTISGFYYISMRRSDGFIEGLYYDPKSAPQQRLQLSPPDNLDAEGRRTHPLGGRRRYFPSYDFR